MFPANDMKIRPIHRATIVDRLVEVFGSSFRNFRAFSSMAFASQGQILALRSSISSSSSKHLHIKNSILQVRPASNDFSTTQSLIRSKVAKRSLPQTNRIRQLLACSPAQCGRRVLIFVLVCWAQGQ